MHLIKSYFTIYFTIKTLSHIVPGKLQALFIHAATLRNIYLFTHAMLMPEYRWGKAGCTYNLCDGGYLSLFSGRQRAVFVRCQCSCNVRSL